MIFLPCAPFGVYARPFYSAVLLSQCRQRCTPYHTAYYPGVPACQTVFFMSLSFISWSSSGCLVTRYVFVPGSKLRLGACISCRVLQNGPRIRSRSVEQSVCIELWMHGNRLVPSMKSNSMWSIVWTPHTAEFAVLRCAEHSLLSIRCSRADKIGAHSSGLQIAAPEDVPFQYFLV